MPSIKYRDPKTGLWQPIPVQPQFGVPGRGVPSGGTSVGDPLCWEWNSKDMMRWNSVPWARVNMNTAFAYASGWSPLLWEGYAGNVGVADPGLPTQLFAPIDGLYEVYCCMETAYVAGQRLGLRILDNSMATVAERTTPQLVSNTSITLATDIQLNALYGIEIDLYLQVSASNIASGTFCYATMRWVAPY